MIRGDRELKVKLENVLNLLKSHTSIRSYESTEIPDEILKQMINSAQHAASSNFVQAYSIIRVTDEDKIKALAKLSKNEQQIMSAPVVLLFCADLKRVEHACKKNNVDLGDHNLEDFIVTVVDTAIVAQNFVVAAESQGYGICYIGGVRNNPEEISHLVRLPDKVFPLFGMTVGVPAETQWVKPRLPVEAILHENNYDEEKYEHIIESYDNTMATYYKERLSNTKDTHWSETMSEFLKSPRRQHMKDFIYSKGFNLNK